MFIDIQTCHACYLMARGKDAAALEAVDNALEVTKGKNVPRHLESEAIAVKAIIAARLGDLTTAESCERSLDEFADNPDVLRTMLCVQAKGTIEMLRGNRDAAQRLFGHAREMARKCGSVQVDAEASLALAVLAELRGDHNQAIVELVRSLKLSLKEGNVGVFIRYGAHTRDMLLEVATSRKTARPLRDFAKRVLSLVDTDEVPLETEELENELSLGVFALTSREQEVLRMLNTGMSRKTDCRGDEHLREHRQVPSEKRLLEAGGPVLARKHTGPRSMRTKDVSAKPFGRLLQTVSIVLGTCRGISAEL